MKRVLAVTCLVCASLGFGAVGSGDDVVHAAASAPASCLAQNNSVDKQNVGLADVPAIQEIAGWFGVTPGAIFSALAQDGIFISPTGGKVWISVNGQVCVARQ